MATASALATLVVAWAVATGPRPCSASRWRRPLQGHGTTTNCGAANADLQRELDKLREENHHLLELAKVSVRSLPVAAHLRQQVIPEGVQDAHSELHKQSGTYLGGYTFALFYWGGVSCLIAMSWMFNWGYARVTDLRQRLATPRPDAERVDLEIIPQCDTLHRTPPELNRDLWGFFLIVCLDKVRTGSGLPVPVYMAAIFNLVMGFMQMFVVFLLVHDINPHAQPITDEPASPWKQSTWSVNIMKWIQVVFMAIALSSEISAAMKLFSNSVLVDAERLRVHRVLPIFFAAFQYSVALWVLFGGVSVVLSFHAVPDILYCSMAIIFVANIDDFMYQYMECVFDMKIDFKVFDDDNPPCHPTAEPNFWPEWLPLIYRVVSIFPVLFAVFLIGQAWYTNEMPNRWIRDVVYPDMKENASESASWLANGTSATAM